MYTYNIKLRFNTAYTGTTDLVLKTNRICNQSKDSKSRNT